MKVRIQPTKLSGEVIAPPSKSLSHRLLIGAALCDGISEINNIAYSKDVEATIDCLRKLGADIKTNNDVVTIDGHNFLKNINGELDCNESGSTLRFLIPFGFLNNNHLIFKGSKRLLERPQDVYETLAKENNFLFKNDGKQLEVSGNLKAKEYSVLGNISSQFITGLIFALSTLKEKSVINIIPPIESKSYIDLTLLSLNYFGIITEMIENKIEIGECTYKPYKGSVEGDESNAAFLDAYNLLGGNVKVLGLNRDTLQGDRVYHEYFKLLKSGCVALDIADCPDLGPILMALGSVLNGVKLLNTKRLKAKECDRGLAMKEELEKMGASVEVKDNKIIVVPSKLNIKDVSFDSHNDHRVVMALSVVCSLIGGTIENSEAVSKSYPDYFDRIKQLKGKVEIR